MQQITPHKTGDFDDGVSALDAAFILQFLVSLRSLDAQQQLACDVTGNGSLSALDAALILQFEVGIIDRFPAATLCDSDWLFLPVPTPVPNGMSIQPQVMPTPCQRGAVAYSPQLTASAANQNFLGMLLGDCTGNWHPTTPTPGGNAPIGLAASARTARLGRLQRGHNGALELPLYGATSAPFSALDLQLRYDPAQLRATHVRRVGRGRSGAMQFNTRVPGMVRIAWASAQPTADDGQPLLVIQFTGRGTVGRTPQTGAESTIQLVERAAAETSP
jgi:hypothetical protein